MSLNLLALKKDKFAMQNATNCQNNHAGLACASGTIVRTFVATILPVAIASMIPQGNVAVAATADGKATDRSMSPEVKLVDDYNARYIGKVGSPEGDLKAELSPFITDKTILHEPISLPWGGTMVGFDGWRRLIRISGPVFKQLSGRMKVSSPKYYQTGNVVLNELTITFKPKRPGEKPYVTAIIEKFTLNGGKITQIDEFWQDTATLIKELNAMGVMEPHHP